MVISSINRYNGILYPSQSQLPTGLANTTHASVVTSAANHHRLIRSAASSGPSQPVAFISNDPVEAKVMIAMALAILSGIIQIIFSVLHIGFVTKYLSDSIVNGFTCGAAFHVVVSQISTLLGIKLGDTHIAFVLVGVIIFLKIIFQFQKLTY
jgi:MFS superfamily sulfate permease-like transporter